MICDSPWRWVTCGCATAVVVVISGCGDDVGVDLVPIAGVVTLDSQPLANAKVVFQPQNGRPSVGVTDDQGRYELLYTLDEPGALPGSHTISISTFLEPDSDSDDPVRMQGRKETVPATYNHRSTLTLEIAPDHAELVNFELTTGDDRTASR